MLSGKGLTTFNINNRAYFAREKTVNEGFLAIVFCSISGKKLKSDLVLVVVLVLESKGLLYEKEKTRPGVKLM